MIGRLLRRTAALADRLGALLHLAANIIAPDEPERPDA